MARLRGRLRAQLRALLAALATIFTISLVTFAAMNYKSPEDVARGVLGREASPVALKAYAHAHGLDRPFHVRYADWVWDFARADWGVSPVSGQRVADDIGPRLVRTLLLSAFAILLSTPLSLALGLFAARRDNKPADVTLLSVLVVLAALPEFVVGILLVAVFGVSLKVLPVDSSGIAFGGLSDQAKAYLLPVVTLVIAMVPYVTRISRAAIRESLAAPFVQAAVLRGLPVRTVTWGHAVRAGAVPIINTIALNIVYLLSGVIVVENVFEFPGIGQALVQAVGSGDAITVEAIAVLMGAIFIGISLLADFVVVYLNPKLRTT
jgi:peptide/nickel transport system permease protein